MGDKRTVAVPREMVAARARGDVKVSLSVMFLKF